MALSEDQRAMLQLLLERGQSYGDIGSLLGLEVDEVRTRARGALTEMAGEDPDRDVGITDYLLGQADPIGRADAARHLQNDAGANTLAAKLEAQLRLLAPAAVLPELPKARAPRPPAKGPGPSKEPAVPDTAGGTPSLDKRQRGLIAALVGGGVLVAVIVLLATGVFDGGGDGGGSASTGTDTGTTATTAAGSGKVTKSLLRPLGDGGGRAVALFGRVRKTPVIQITAVGLEQPPSGQTYYVWLYRSDNLALRVGGFNVDQKGRAVTQIRIPTEALALVANETFDQVEITLTSDADYRAALDAARKQNALPALTGTGVLRGEITGPIVGAARATGTTGATGNQGG